MRLLPIITAVLVSVFLYFLIIERDTLLALARGEDAASLETAVTNNASSAQEVAAGKAHSGPAEVGVVAIHSRASVIDSAVILRGQTEAARQVDVRAETTGLVISEPLRKGAFVEEGQVLCRLDPGTRASTFAETRARLLESEARVPEAEAQLPRAEAQLENAKAQLETAYAQREEAEINYNAALKLAEGGYASDSRVASAKAAMRAAEAGISSAKASVKSAEAGVKTAQSGVLSVKAGIQSAEAAVATVEKEISRLEITAPFEGLLESDAAELGALLQPGAICATVIQLDPIKLVAYVPETEIDRISVGSLAGARLTSGQELRGRVSFLSRSADPLTRTFRVEIAVPNPGLDVRDGQTVEIVIASDGANAHLVPQSALTLNDDGVLGIRVVDSENQALFQPITLVRDTADGVWISDLPDEADIIVIGQEYVVDGVPVRAAYEEAAK
ncbi:efflux RND transporter periplasmic adaptor subunit [Rhodobacteraceae bacterium LMO-12]|nr:efflux RND transporter periplasmic adaptor subunit [Rhodobacteraceae bacterium LMO-JJ12]